MNGSKLTSRLFLGVVAGLALVASGCGASGGSGGSPPPSGPSSWPGPGETVWASGVTSVTLVTESGGDTIAPPAGSTCGDNGSAAERFELDVATRVLTSHLCTSASSGAPWHWVDRTQTLSAADADALVKDLKAVTVATTCGTCSAVATPNTVTLQVAGEARTYSDDDFCTCKARGATPPFANHLLPAFTEARKLAYQ